MRKTWLCVALLGLAFARSADAAEKPWVQVSSANFEVETDAGERQARQLLEQFERMRWVFRTLFPQVHADPPEPILVIAVRNSKEFQDYEPADYEGRGKMKLAGYFEQSAQRNFILLRLDAEDEHPYTTVYHEYTHFQFRHISSRMPVWLNEGLAEFFQNTVIEPKYVQLGMPSVDDILYLRQQTLIPLDVLFRVDQSSPYYHEENKGSVFYAESWALTHYLQVQDRKDGKKRLVTYLTLVMNNTDPVEAATQAFGNLHALTNTLEGYIRNGNYMQFQMNTAAAPIDVSAFPLATLTQVQVEAARANILMDLGRESDAKALIQQVLAQDPKNVEVRETLGIEALHKGERDDAQKWLGESVALGAQGFEVNMMYAELLMSSPDSDEAQIESCLRAAIRANPRDARIHDLLAHREAMDHSRLADALQQSEQAVALDPGNVAYRETAAFEQEQMGKLGDAEKTLQAALAVAHTPEEKQSLQERLDDLQHMPQVVGPPTPTAVQSSAKGAIDIPAADANGPDQGLVNQGIGNQGITDQDSDDQRPRIARARAGSSGANGPVDIPPQPSATGVVTQPSDTPKHPDAANGPKHSAEGVMRLVHCSYPMEIEFELVGRKKTVQVYNNHFNQLQMSAVGFSPQGSMNPCRDFEGMKARIQYAESTDKTVDGKVLSIVLMK